MRLGFSGEALELRGRPRLRVRGARTMRWERVSVPLPIVRGVKSLEEEPRGASSAEVIPFPGRAASLAEIVEGALRIEPIVLVLVV
jgi:hypothetical protein